MPPKRSTSSVSPTRRRSSPRIARPQRLYDYAQGAKDRGLKADHRRRRRRRASARHGGVDDQLCRCSACRSKSKALKGLDSLLSIVQMPAGVPVGTLAIGRAGAVNAALLAAAILALGDEALGKRIEDHRARQTASVAELPE